MSSSPSPIQHGYLVLADISGYTSFLSQTELDHAHEILSDLLETVLRRFQSLLTIHKIEGDAIFAYAAQSALARPETLLELIEATYVDFRERARNVRRHTTCTCRACESIPMLDLKFMAHHGDFILQNIGGTREMAGSDVNLVHRLLKNHVSESTGWRAYALFTRRCLEHMDLKPEGLVESVESYEHLGEVAVCVMDLHQRYDQIMQSRRVVIEPAEAFLTLSQEFNVPPPVVWDALNDPVHRAQANLHPESLRFVPIFRPGGRTGTGATTHCVHGKDIAMRETVLDWKPFDYYTVEQDSGMMGILDVTFSMEALEDGRTRLTAHMNGRHPWLPHFLHRSVFRYMFTRMFDYGSTLERLRDLLNAEAGDRDAKAESLES